MYSQALPYDSELIRNSDWLDHLVERAPRLAALSLIAMAWAITLAWPPSTDNRPLVAGQSIDLSSGEYPLRVALPSVGDTISLEQLIALSETYPVIRQLDLLPKTVPQEPDEAALALVDNATVSAARISQSNTVDFASAFSDFTASLSASQRSDARAAAALAVAEGMEPGAFLNLNYDLSTLTPSTPAGGSSSNSASFDASDGSLTVTKPLLVDGESKGRATIRIEEGAQIFIATSAVAEALGPRAQDLPTRIATAIETGSGFIPFHELRGAGVAVEYDPVTDRVSLSMPSGA
ncbi:hypothetical protein BPTFM16_01322 [Altererythrobacter insulae]|nr:hypothetical protein BPTFM16_01322 [Altererythrobacter insulae]